jgi:hypothetical protein
MCSSASAYRICTYLDVRREEGELQRPPVLHAAGDHTREEQPRDAHLRRPASTAGDLYISGHRSSDVDRCYQPGGDMDGDLWKWKGRRMPVDACT